MSNNNFFWATAATIAILYLNAKHHKNKKNNPVNNKIESYPQVLVLPNMQYRRFYEQPTEDTRRDGLSISSKK